MRGLHGLLFAFALAAVGCQSGSTAVDPFLRSRVPPPATGQIGPAPVGGYGGAPLTPVMPPPGGAPLTSPPPAAPYGAPPAPTYQTPPPAMNFAPPPSSNGAPQYAPPGGGWSPTSSRSGPPNGSVYPQAAMQRELRPLAESARAGSLADAAREAPQGAAAAPSEHGLEPAQGLSQTPMPSPLRNPRDTKGVEPVSYSAPAGASPRTARGPYAPSGTSGNGSVITAERQGRAPPITSGSGPADRGATYGFDGNYSWLQGQLEYSAATKQWKLRYIPIDGPTDRYGGSVVLAATPALAGYKAGDFVSVKGKVDGTRTSQGTFAPTYQVTAVDRLSD